MKKIRVGSIGIGGISRGVHLPGIAKSPDLEVAAVCDIRPEALEFAQRAYGVKKECCFEKYEDLICCPEVDAVDISTPNRFHFEMAMAAVKAGKPYAVEKPMTMDPAQAEKLAAATREAGVKSMVCFSYRYKSAARYMRDLIRKGTLGRIYHIDMEYYQAWGLPLFGTPKVWRFDKAQAASGALGDLGSHGLDLVRFVTGHGYTRVTGHTGTFTDARPDPVTGGMSTVDVDDFSNAMAEMDDGTAVTFRITRFAYGRGNYQMMEVYGEKGALIYTLDENGQGQDSLRVCLEPLGRDNQQFETVRIPGRYRADQMQSFADLLLGRGDGLTADVGDGLRNMRDVDAVLRSAASGSWQRVE